LNVLALNSGSSSLKFGLYRVGSFRTEMLLSDVAELIGEKNGKFYAQDSRETALLCETVSIPSQREAIMRIGRLLADSKMRTMTRISPKDIALSPFRLNRTLAARFEINYVRCQT
jgi:acetate kinase